MLVWQPMSHPKAKFNSYSFRVQTHLRGAIKKFSA